MFSFPGFALTQVMARQRGVPDEAATRISFIGGAVGLTPLGIVVTDSLIRREVDSAAAVSTTLPAPTPTAEVPPVVGVSREQAEASLAAKKFTNVKTVVDPKSPAAENTVIAQAPVAGEVVPIDTTVTLTLSAGEQEAPADDKVREKAELVTAKIHAISDEIVRALPAVTPHVRAAFHAIKQSADQVVAEPAQQEQAEGAGAAAAAQQPDGAAKQQADEQQQQSGKPKKP